MLVSAASASLPFFFFYLTPVLSSPLCPLLHLSFYFNFSGRSGRNCLLFPFVLSGYSGSPDTCFSVDELADGERYSCPLQSLVVSFNLLYPLFSYWRRTVSSKFFDTQVSSIFTEEPVLPHHACCALSRLRCNEHSVLLNSYLSKIGRIENCLCSTCGHLSQDTSPFFCTVQLRTLSTARSLVTLCLSSIFGTGPGPGFWGSMVFHYAPIPRKGSWNNNNNNNRRFGKRGKFASCLNCLLSLCCGIMFFFMSVLPVVLCGIELLVAKILDSFFEVKLVFRMRLTRVNFIFAFFSAFACSRFCLVWIAVY